MNNPDLLTILTNLYPVLDDLVSLITKICALIGVYLIGSGLVMFYALSADDGRFRGHGQPTAGGAISNCLIGGVLITPLVILQQVGNQLFAGSAMTVGPMMYQTAGSTPQQQMAIKAIFGLFMLVGYITFVSGWIKMNKHANGVIKDGAVAALIQIIFGAALVYLDQILDMVSGIAGIDFMKVLFF